MCVNSHLGEQKVLYMSVKTKQNMYVNPQSPIYLL